jgi:hypothetical protein
MHVVKDRRSGGRNHRLCLLPTSATEIFFNLENGHVGGNYLAPL